MKSSNSWGYPLIQSSFGLASSIPPWLQSSPQYILPPGPPDLGRKLNRVIGIDVRVSDCVREIDLHGILIPPKTPSDAKMVALNDPQRSG